MTVTENRITEVVKYILGHNEVTLETNVKDVASLSQYHRILSAISDEYDIDIPPNFTTIKQIADYVNLFAK